MRRQNPRQRKEDNIYGMEDLNKYNRIEEKKERGKCVDIFK